METTGGSTNHKRLRGGGHAADVRTDGALVPQAALSVVVVPGRTPLRMKNSAKRKLLSWKVSCGYGAVV